MSDQESRDKLKETTDSWSDELKERKRKAQFEAKSFVLNPDVPRENMVYYPGIARDLSGEPPKVRPLRSKSTAKQAEIKNYPKTNYEVVESYYSDETLKQIESAGKAAELEKRREKAREEADRNYVKNHHDTVAARQYEEDEIRKLRERLAALSAGSSRAPERR